MGLSEIAKMRFQRMLGTPAAAKELTELLDADAGTPAANKAVVLNAAGGLGTPFQQSALKIAVTAQTAAGTNLGSAAAIQYGVNLVSAANNTAGVQLPVAVANQAVIVKSSADNRVLKVYPQTNSDIDNLGANNSFDIDALATSSSGMTFIATNATHWESLPHVAS